MKIHYLLIFYFSLLNLLWHVQIFSISAYTITSSQPIKDGQILVSQSETFELGFFSPSNSTNRYLGIWYKTIPFQTIVWVANRDSPLNDSSGVVMISSTGNLVVIRNRTNQVIWSTNTSNTIENTVAEFLESGNLVLRETHSDGYLWQSFDYPSDTLLPGMKFGWNLKTGLNRYITSWKNFDDPSRGDFTREIDLTGFPEPVMRYRSSKYYRSGPWNGIRFSGAPDIKANSIFTYDFVQNENEVYSSFQLVNRSVISRVVLKQTGDDGQLERLTWVEQSQSWVLHVPIPRDRCDAYGLCGDGSTCDTTDVPVCQCLKGFKPRSPSDWNGMDWSRGCERVTPLDCDKGDGFVKFKELKLPDTTHSWMNMSMDLEECSGKCLKNCSCMAYTHTDIRGNGSGCAMWFGDLIDIRQLDSAGQDLHIRMSASELDAGVPKETKTDQERKKPRKLIVILPAVSIIFLLGLFMCFICRRKILQKIQNKLPDERACQDSNQDSSSPHVFIPGTRDQPGKNKDNIDLVQFDLDTIVAATYNFSNVNMLGQGGFGCVYKGTFEDGQTIAVKRLSKSSVQGVEEFKNEVMLIARLQHRNLVRLLGSCIEGDEKLLVYEYMENKGLDSILFDKANNIILDWPTRFNIIIGISRGLLYLHQDSRFRIVHRDLKASNVLLDGEMTPKISDFGMARIFGGDESEGKTKRVVGTYGYMSPEYAMRGLFSVKSDVFSFGVLVLEIISGKKNNTFFCSDGHLNLLGYAWKLWKDGLAKELVDESMEDSFLPNEALRCIQVGLLSVQERAKDRPTMSSVVSMLSSDSTTFPQPKLPGFCYVRSPFETESPSIKKNSVNHVTITMLEAR